MIFCGSNHANSCGLSIARNLIWNGRLNLRVEMFSFVKVLLPTQHFDYVSNAQIGNIPQHKV